MQDNFSRARTRPSARATIGYLVYKLQRSLIMIGKVIVLTIINHALLKLVGTDVIDDNPQWTYTNIDTTHFTLPITLDRTRFSLALDSTIFSVLSLCPTENEMRLNETMKTRVFICRSCWHSLRHISKIYSEGYDARARVDVQ